MQANEQELAMALRGGLRGRFQASFHLLENAFEVLDDRMAHSVTPTEYETLRPLLQQIAQQLVSLRRLGEHAADAAIAPVLQQVCEPRPMELLGQLRELGTLLNEILVQEQLQATVQVEAEQGLPILLTLGDDTLLNGFPIPWRPASRSILPWRARRGCFAIGMTGRVCRRMPVTCCSAACGAAACWSREDWDCR